MSFRRYTDRPTGPFEAALLPRDQKEQLCRELLVEFGATHITVGGRERDELVHGCLISDYHRDQRKSPTAALNFDKLTYNCFGCGAHGGLLWFIATCRGGTSEKARVWLSTHTEDRLSDTSALLAYFDSLYAGRAKPPPIPRYSARILEPWMNIHPYLTEGASELGLPGRGLSDEVIRRFRLGWDPVEDRIILPHFWKEHLVGWQSRRIWADGSQKYLSSPDFPKDRTLFNADDPLIGERPVVVVESAMTVYAHCGQWPVVATFGAELTEAQLRLLRRFPKIVTFFDNDRAGWKATRLVQETLDDGAGTLVYSVDNPYTSQSDAGDLSPREFGDLVEAALAGDCVDWRSPAEDLLIDYPKE